MIVVCKNCGNEYSSRKGKTCSLKCRDEFAMKQRRKGLDLKKNCENCGKEYEIHFFKRKDKDLSKFCSMTCVGENNRRLISGTKIVEHVIVKCARPSCENTFERPKKDGKVKKYKVFCSKSCRGKAKISGYRHLLHSKTYFVTLKDGNKLRVRSRWEASLIKNYLEPNNIEFQYEPKTFTFDDGTSYTPDFYLPQYNKYLEVKGYEFKGMEKVEQLRLLNVEIDYLNADILTDVYGLDLRPKTLQLLVEEI